jgi:CubicO group peptidase (beta-lactamase class C family)
VLHDGEVVYEAYPDLKPYQKHLAWSVTKVFVSTALAILEHQGKVNMSLPVEHYLPELKNTAWMGTSVQNIVNMASGMDCLDSDGYQNTTTCIYQYEESLGITARKNKPITTLEHIKQVKRRAPQGTINEYVSINTYVVGMVIESVTEKPLWLAMQDLIWSNIGAEADALFTVSPQGNAYTSGGLNARLRDIARFGELFTSEQGIKVIGKAHLADLKSGNIIQFNNKQKQSYTDSFGNDLPTHAAWQWDHIWPDGDMYKSGYSGQGIFVSPERKLVIAFFGTHGKDWKEHQLDAISRQLSRSGLFPSD